MVADPIRGQVWEYISGSRQYRIVIVSSDEYNEHPRSLPWGLVVERGAPTVPGFLVGLGAGDPLAGASVVVPLILRCDRGALSRLLGFVSNDTMNAIERGLRELLNLP